MKIEESLVPIVSSTLAEQILSIPAEVNELDEATLINIVKPNNNLKRLRVKFNHERNLAQYEERTISIQSICNGIIHPNYWSKLVEDRNKLAYIIRPLPSVEEEFQVLQSDFMVGLKKIAETDPLGGTIKVSEWLTAVKMIMDRTAPVVQRIHQLTETKKHASDKPKEIEDINKKIKLLEEKLGKQK